MIVEKNWELLDVNCLPASFYTDLQKPTGGSVGEVTVLPDELLIQYGISKYFPTGERFKNLLLFLRVLKLSTCQCQLKTNQCCLPRLYICELSCCWQSLRRGFIPKFAIAQCNWIGQLPEELRNMTDGSRSLIRPMQSFGLLVAFYNGGGCVSLGTFIPTS